MHHSSGKFLLKYFIIMFLSFAVMQTKIHLSNSVPTRFFTLNILNIKKTTIDSLLSGLNTNEKIQLLVNTQQFYIDTLNYNMITDTAFLYNYLDSKFSEIKRKHKSFYAYYPLLNAPNSLNDSLFLNFIHKRYKKIYKLAEKNGLIAGWIYPKNINDSLKNICDTLHTEINPYQHFLKSEIAFHIFDNKDYKQNNFKFEGLKISLHKNKDTINEQLIINYLNSDFQMLLINKNEEKKAIELISALIKKYPYYQKLFDEKLRKIIKYDFFIQNIKANNVYKKKNDRLENYLLTEKSIFVIEKNSALKLPLNTNSSIVYTIIDLTDSLLPEFLNVFSKYALFRIMNTKKFTKKLQKSIKYQKHIILIDNSTFTHFSKDSLKNLFTKFPKDKNILINFGKFTNLQLLTDSLNIVQMYYTNKISAELAPQVLFGGLEISAQIPQNLNKQIKFGKQHKLKAVRLGYAIPERVNISSVKLKKIDEIVKEGLNKQAFPGCQVLVAKNGKVIYSKSYGYHTYQHKNRVYHTDLYDLASLTKISATTLAAMKMINDKKMNLSNELANFFKNTKIDYTRIKPDTIIKADTFFVNKIKNINSFIKNKDTIKIDSLRFIVIDTIIRKLTPKNNIFKVEVIDLLKHKSGISPSLPIYKYVYYRYLYFKQLINTHKNFQKQLAHLLKLPYVEIPDTLLKQMKLPDSLKQIINTDLKNIYYQYFSKIKTDSSNIQICSNLYLRNNYFDTIWSDTKQLPVSSRKYTKYSDINMILLQMAIDSLNQMSIDQYMKNEFYNPLGLRSISYHPLNYFDKNRIIPTELDRSWRYSLLQGYVHDPSSAILGGIAGNAGLFANIDDLSILFQMVLNGGSYGGIQFIKPEIIKQFTTRQDDTQRALGFDMPNSHAVVGNLAPLSTYGHSGYTGTCVWLDPENELIYIFLSNRVHPTSKNWKIIKYHIRERIHDAIYDAMEKDN